ncbi:MAG: hypothetical protein ACI4NM_01625 [Bullifex sp.]
MNIPIEVKAETNLKAKSLKTYHERFSPELSVRTSMADYRDEGWLINLPLYAIEEFSGIADSRLLKTDGPLFSAPGVFLRGKEKIKAASQINCPQPHLNASDEVLCACDDIGTFLSDQSHPS